MRTVIPLQLSLGEADIGAIKIDVTSRDDIPLVLLGLQEIYTNASLKAKVFKILEEIIPTQQQDGKAIPVSSERGCPGMNQWAILVLVTLRIALNTDFDRIQELPSQHWTLREMLGHSEWNDKNYRACKPLRTIYLCSRLRSWHTSMRKSFGRVMIYSTWTFTA